MDKGNAAEDVRLGVYMRVSTNDQKKQETIETQRGVLTRYIDRDDLAGTVYAWYEDEAVSGSKIAFAQRPSGARLMADIRAGHVNIILVRKLDRLGRNAREILNAVHEIEAVGARLISLKENVDTRTSAGRFFLTVLAGVAQLEAEMIAERTDEGRARRLESTSWMGGKPPYGLRILGERKDSRLIINDIVDTESGYSEHDVMRLMWHLLVEEDWPTDRIAAYLTETGIPTRDGKHVWSGQVVWRLLTSPTYVGQHLFRTKDGAVYTNPVPAIFTEDEWQRAQAALREHKRYNRTKRPNRDWLLGGLIFCTQCGAPYVATNTRISSSVTDPHHRPTMYPYYKCSTRLKRQRRTRRGWDATGGEILPDCDAASVAAHVIEAAIWARIEQFARDPGPVLTLLAEKRDTEAAHVERYRSRLAELQQTLEEIQSQRDAVLALYRRQRISERDLDRQLDDIAREEDGHARERERLLATMQRDTDGAKRLDSARTLLQQLHARLDGEQITPELKREAMQRFVARVVVETVEAGLSARGKPKRRAKAKVTFTFEAPASTQFCDTTPSRGPRSS
jgi:site-specific DNA recombinase